MAVNLKEARPQNSLIAATTKADRHHLPAFLS